MGRSLPDRTNYLAASPLVMPPVPFAEPDITESDIAGVVEVLRGKWLTTGPRVKQFEREFGVAVGAGQVIAVNSCTAAMHLALDALGIGPGDEVIVPSLTFAATAEVVAYVGAKPVLVDICADDHNIDPAGVEAAWTERTKAVMPVHFGGQPSDMDEVAQIAKAGGGFTIADAAHCFPATYRGRPVGTLADISCFSFYATKTITTGEGGAAVTADDGWADRMRSMSLHGISRDAWKRYMADGDWYYEIEAAGFKYNLTEIAGSLGLTQLARADAMLRRRAAIALEYDRAFGQDDAIELLVQHPDRTSARHLYVVKLRDGVLRTDRDMFIRSLREAGIGASVHFIPLHLHPFYRRVYGYEAESLPIANRVYRTSISLPIYSAMTAEQVNRVIDVVTGLTRALKR